MNKQLTTRFLVYPCHAVLELHRSLPNLAFSRSPNDRLKIQHQNQFFQPESALKIHIRTIATRQTPDAIETDRHARTIQRAH